MRHFFTLRGWPVAVWAAAMLAAFCGALFDRRARADDELLQAQFRQAVDLQLRGKSADSDARLQTLLSQQPDFAPARWHLGFVKFDGDWLQPEQIETRTRASDAIQEYRRRRDEVWATQSLPDVGAAHFALANWCHKHHLSDEERVHLLEAVRFDARFLARAARRLGLREYKGQLLTADELAASKERDARLERDFQRWRPQLLEICQAMKRGGQSEQSARNRLLQIDDLACIPAMESLTLPSPRSDKPVGDVPSFNREVIELLADFSEYEATASLARHAVLAESAEIRTSAAKQLQHRELRDFVPTLLSGFVWPMEFTYQVKSVPGAVVYSEGHRPASYGGLRRNLTESSWEFIPPQSGFYATLVTDGPQGTIERSFVGTTQGWLPRSNDVRGLSADGQRLQQAIAVFNAQLPERNERVARALGTGTGISLNHGWDPTSDEPATDPDAWYQWWSRYNEYYIPEEKPYVNLEYWSHSRGLYADGGAWHVATLSCFPRGVQVATFTGAAPIESIHIGDRVLSQDPQTGELSYKRVLGTTVRPPAALLDITAGANTLRCTRGHPLWVVGQGWRMAKELKGGDRLWAVGKTVTVDSITPLKQQEEAFNLVVADFGTYFVGSDRILVHDNTPQRPTRALLPGYVPDGRVE